MTQSQSRTQSRRGSFYPAVISAVSIIATAIFTLIFSTGAGAWAIAPAVLIVLSEIVKGVTDAVIPRLVTSRGLPRLALRGGVPRQARTIVIITALLSSPEAAREAAGRMERYSITNRDAGENLVFGLLADLPEAQAATAAGDAEIIAAAQKAVAELRRRAGDGFFLFLRRRERAREGVFRGWERKRGAVCQLMRALRGGDDIDISDAARRRLGHIQYVIAIDADTRLTAGAAAELIGTIHHPSNRPVINPETRTVTRGHGIIQPRIVTALRDADATALARAFSGGGGVDIYGGSRGEIYQDISGKSSFVGKGIIDVDAYLQCLDGRLPSNRVLSHDLPEGAYLRCGFAGDITLTDSHPATAAAYYERLHRWTRGDWQNAPWLLPRVPGGGGDMTPNPMDCIDKWRVLDNLRRSLLPPCALAIILLCFNSAQYRPAAAAAAVALVFGHIMAAAGKIRHILIHLRRAAARLLLLPIEAGVYISAAAIALFRMTVTKRRLLQWVTAADSDAVTRRGNMARCLRLALAGVLAALAAGAVSVSRGDAISAALCAVWCLSPVFAAVMSRRRRKKRPPARRRAYLLRSARAAYRYFTDFITAENNFLPPDNFQEHIGTPARQTSPTNIGLALLAPIAAVELRLTNQRAATALIGAMLRSVERLPKWRGHLYNWYDVRTARVAQPRFISAVDSGNFAVCLAALESALIEYGEQPLAERAARLYRDMDFTALYDKNRQLFLVGAGETAVYDRMASETVLTSFIAIARGEAPVRHWRALSRAAVRVGGRRGMASWTGTMFEYLMPMLFLPYYERSLLRAAASVCVYAHKKAAGRSPWGSSESAYFEYDERGGYKYKAHGAASIAVRRGMERDAVIAPYAGQLAVELDPGGATANLRRLEKLGAFGRYGFMDAVDFTRRRVGKTPKLVPIYMAHHIGMGLIATANYLSDGVFRRYFMSRRETEAFCELLEERAPDAP